MKKTSINLMFFLIVINSSFAQQTLFKTEFPVHDFTIENDTMFYIEKRDIKIKSLSNSSPLFHQYFIGGYGLKISESINNDEIISVSNEFTNPVTSVRFYNKKTQKVEQVYYYITSRAIDALIIPELNYVVLSLNNNKIIVLDYQNKPSFNIVKEIQLNAIARSLKYEKGVLYFGTDKGEIFKFQLSNDTKTLLYNFNQVITNLNILKNQFLISTLNGKLIQYNNLHHSFKTIQLNNNFILNSLSFQQNQLICGTFNGTILIVDIDKMEIKETLNYHKRSVLNIVNEKDNIFYSSSIDKTIKKWQLN